MTAPQTPPSDHVGTPTAIWWLDDTDSTTQADDSAVADSPTTATATPTATPPASRFLSRLSQRLVLTYTSHSDVVVDLLGDPHVRQATEQSGRTYLQVADRAAIADLDRRATPTSLIVVSLQSAPTDHPLTSITDLFLACRLMMTADVATLAFVGPADLGQEAHERRQDAQRAAATSAGLHPTGRILAVHQPGHADQFLYYADDQDAAAALATEAPNALPVMRIDLFTTTAGDSSHD